MANQFIFKSGGLLGVGSEDLNIFVSDTGLFQADKFLSLEPYSPFRILTKTTAGGKVRIPRMAALALGLREKDCDFVPAPGATFGTQEFDTCPVKFNSEFCDTEVLDQMFTEHKGWGIVNGEETPTEDGMKLLVEFVSMTVTAAVKSVFNTLTWGGYGTLTFLPANTVAVNTALTNQHNACEGYLSVIEDGVVDYPNYDVPLALATGNVNAATGAFVGSVVDVYDQLAAAAPAELQEAITYGSVTEMEDGVMKERKMAMLVDSNLYAAIMIEYNQQEFAPTNAPKRLSMVSGTLADFGMQKCDDCIIKGMENGRINVLFIDRNIAIIPDPRINFLDSYTNKWTRAAILTVAKNILFVTSYTSADNFVKIAQEGGSAQEVGLLVSKKAQENGDGYTTKMQALITAGIVTPAYVSARLLQVTKI